MSYRVGSHSKTETSSVPFFNIHSKGLSLLIMHKSIFFIIDKDSLVFKSN